MMRRWLLISSFLATGLLASGCASTATGRSSSALAGQGSKTTLQKDVPDGGVLTVIRYPAVVETSAQDAFHKAYGARAIGGRLSSSAINSTDANIVADSMVVKSNYFALSLFKALAARLPEHSVLLSPHAITLDSSGELSSKPITSAEKIPAVLSVDFVTYSYPDSNKMMGGTPLTFGDLVTPLVTVRTDHRAAAPTQGVLMGYAPLVPYAAGEGRHITSLEMNALQSGTLSRATPELDLISYLRQDATYTVSKTGLGRKDRTNFVAVVPVEKIKMDEAALEVINRPLSRSDGKSQSPDAASDLNWVDPLEAVYSVPLANQLIAQINMLDVKPAIMMGKAVNVAEFDPSLAALTFVGSNDADYAARLAYAERLLEAQRKYLSVQSLRVFDGVHNGEMGAQMRDMIKAEYDVLERRRKLARQQNMANMLAVAGVLGGVAIGTQTGSNGTVSGMNRVLSDIAIAGGIYAATEASALKRQSKSVGSNYLASIVPALDHQTTISVDLLNSNETITAIRYEDLQAKLQSLYSSRQRSLDRVATRCAYLDEAGARRGSWLGDCAGGLANGPGVGVLKQGGQEMEYYGYAQAGLASGPGLMIQHMADKSLAFEGSFSKGKPHGAVRLSQPGQADVVRHFIDGRDSGSSSARPASPFKDGSAQSSAQSSSQSSSGTLVN